MSALATAAGRARHLRVATATGPSAPAAARAASTVPALHATPEAPVHASAGDTRPAVLRLCAGETLVLTDAEIDLVELVNTAGEFASLLDEETDPDDYRLAEILVEYLCTHHGTHRQAKGDRLGGVITNPRRHLLPFLIELAETRPVDRRGVAHLRLPHLEMLPRLLAGDAPLPAATVAGDLLGRRGVACVYLTLADAARVVTGGEHDLLAALESGAVAVVQDARTGQPIVSAASLRSAGLLIESSEPHGLAASYAGNVLRDLGNAIARGRDLGATIRGTFKLNAIDPLPERRKNPEKQPAGYLSMKSIAAHVALLPAIAQVVLWIGRLVGERISEIYGLNVCDYIRDENDRPWLVIDKQGGLSSLSRDPQTGRFRRQDFKDHTKTPAGARTIPIPRQLADLLDLLIAVFHTDAETGQIDWSARLIPGIQRENASGQSAFRSHLATAQEQTGVQFDPHDLRACLITDLKNAGIDERLAHYYAGHERPNATIQDKHYDLGPFSDLLHPIADLLETQIADQLGAAELKAPTALRTQWGRNTRRHRQAVWIEQQLQHSGWGVCSGAEPGLGRELNVAAVATMLGKHPTYARRLMREGTIASHRIPWGTRETWAAYESDVQRYLRSLEGTSTTDLSEELGLSYHQVWHILRDLSLVDPGRPRGAAVRLQETSADAVRAEVARRAAVSADAVTVAEAAQLLDMEVGTVGTLIRQGLLEVTDGPTGVRRQYVTRRSVHAFLEKHPATAPSAGEEDVLLTGAEVRRALGVTRSQLTSLITTRQLTIGSKNGSRHVYITASSASDWAQSSGRPDAARRLRDLAAQRSASRVRLRGVERASAVRGRMSPAAGSERGTGDNGEAPGASGTDVDRQGQDPFVLRRRQVRLHVRRPV